MVEILEWVRVSFGSPGLISLASVAVVGYMLKLFVAALRDVSTGSSAGLQQISEILQAQEETHKTVINNQIQHTEILRSLAIEVKSLGENMYRSELERTHQLVDLVSQLAQKNSPHESR